MSQLNDREIEQLLQDWGGYVRTYRPDQGILHRVSERGLEGSTRSPGTHSDPTLANLCAEASAGIAFMSSVDRLLSGYPSLWRAMLDMRYVGERSSTDRKKPWRLLDWPEIEKRLPISERDRKAAMALIRRQTKIDVEMLSGRVAFYQWRDSIRVAA